MNYNFISDELVDMVEQKSDRPTICRVLINVCGNRVAKFDFYEPANVSTINLKDFVSLAEHLTDDPRDYESIEIHQITLDRDDTSGNFYVSEYRNYRHE